MPACRQVRGSEADGPERDGGTGPPTGPHTARAKRSCGFLITWRTTSWASVMPPRVRRGKRVNLEGSAKSRVCQKSGPFMLPGPGRNPLRMVLQGQRAARTRDNSDHKDIMSLAGLLT